MTSLGVVRRRSDRNGGGGYRHRVRGWWRVDVLALEGKCHLYRFICNGDFNGGTCESLIVPASR